MKTVCNIDTYFSIVCYTYCNKRDKIIPVLKPARYQALRFSFTGEGGIFVYLNPV